MKCQKAREWFDDYLNGVLDEPALADLKAHLGNCGECAGELRFLKTVRQKTAGLPEEKAPADLLARVHQRIGAEERRGLFPKLPFGAVQFAGAAVVLILAVIIFKINSHPILNETPQNLLTRTDEMQTVQKSAPSNPVASETPIVKNDQQRASVNAGKPSGGLVATVPIQAPMEAKVATVEQISVRVILTTGNKTVLADKAETEAANNAPLGFSKAKSAQKETTDASLREITASDPVKVVFDKYQGRVIKTENPAGSEEWVFEIPAETFQTFLTDLAKIGSVNEVTEGTGEKKPGKVELNLITEP